MMEAEMVSETLGFYPQLTRLVAREHFMEFSRRESFKTCTKETIPRSTSAGFSHEFCFATETEACRRK
jgi:hypothetical protein